VSNLLHTAKELFEIDSKYWEPIYRAAREDIYFLSDNDDAQWHANDLKARQKTGRPVLTIDQLTQYVNQVVNDGKKKTPEIEVIPSHDADVDTAAIIQDIIRDISYTSNADTAFDTAFGYSVMGGVGFFMLDHEYVSEESFEQRLVIKEVHDPFTCYLDSKSKDITGKDADHNFILEAVSENDFKKRFRNKQPVSFTGDSFIECEQGDIIIAQYFKKVIKKKTLGLTDDGRIEEVQEGIDYAITREVEEVKVKRYLLSGQDVLEKTDFVCNFMPLVAVFGAQKWVNGKREIQSLIRRSKDAQRMFNYWKSLETELLQKQPRANFLAQAGQVEDFREAWENPDASPVLTYKGFDLAGNPVGPPQRLDPPQIPAGILQASRGAIDDIKATIGMYSASLGEQSNEVSGVAIQRRNEEGETATYHFDDNLNKSITQLGKMIVSAIPKIYDTPRVVRKIDRENTVKSIGINGVVLPEQERSYDLTRAGYDVRIIPGIAHTTQRQQAAQFFEAVVTRQPELMSVMGDLLFKNMDFAGAQAMADRMKKFIDPKYLDEQSEYDPEKEQMAGVIEQGQQLITQQQEQIESLVAQLEDKKNELDIKALAEENKKEANVESTKIDLLKLEAEREKTRQDYEFKMAALLLKQQELNLRAHEKIRDIEIEEEVEEPEEYNNQQEE